MGQKSNRKWYKTLHGITGFLNILANIALCLSLLSAHLSPISTVIPVFFGLTFPFWFILNILFVIFWLFRKKFNFVITLALLAVSWPYLSDSFQFRKPAGELPPDGIRVFSYNAHLFDIYRHRANEQNKTHRKIYRFIEEMKNDILCFQEFYNEDAGEIAVLDSLLAIQDAKNYHIDFFQTRRKHHHWGIATFTKYPIINRQRFQFRNSTGNYCIYTDVLYKEDTLRIFNTHLESWHFEHNDYEFIKHPESIQDSAFSMSLKNIYWKIETAYLKRAIQIEQLTGLIKESPYPVIVAGDFNDPPVSYTYRQMTGFLKDSFKGNGSGFGKTYTKGLPYFRIDYIFHDKNFNTEWYKTYAVPFSDHYPVSAVLNYEQKE